MLPLKKQGSLVFLLLLIIHCIAIYLEITGLRNGTKYLLMPVLIGQLWFSAGKTAPLISYLAVFFSWAGDILLSAGGEIYFLLGMLAFIVTHICNSIYFFRLQDRQNARLREPFIAALLLMLVSATVFAVLHPYLGSLRIPIVVYMVIISIMAILAAATSGNKAYQAIARQCFIPGAGLFVISDALLAMNKFLFHRALLDIIVMLTYGAAQYFLVQGYIRHSSKNPV